MAYLGEDVSDASNLASSARAASLCNAESNLTKPLCKEAKPRLKLKEERDCEVVLLGDDVAIGNLMFVTSVPSAGVSIVHVTPGGIVYLE